MNNPVEYNRKNRHWAVRPGAGFVWRPYFLLLSLLLVVCLGRIYPLHAQSCADTAGRVERDTYPSAILGSQMVYSIYLPPCYDSKTQAYPVIYLMHGSNDDDHHWLRLGLAELLDQHIRTGDWPPLVVVLPFGNVIANRNRFDAVSWGNIFLNELMPAVEGRYQIDARREMRAIGGISRGGFWAFHIAFRNPDLFSAVGGHSAFFDLYHAPPESNPLDLALNAADIETLRIWLDRGQQDYAYFGLDVMGERLRTRQAPHEYQIYPEGEHNNEYWSQHIADYLDFYTADWQAKTPEVPMLPTLAATASASEMPMLPTLAVTAAEPVMPVTGTDNSLSLYLPAVSFPSLQTTITADRLQAVWNGQPDTELVLDEETANALIALGVPLASSIRIVEPHALFNSLWRNRLLYTLLPFERLTPRYRVLHIDEVHPLDTDLTTYPFAFTGASPNFDPAKLTRITLSGVTALTRHTREVLDEHGVEWAGEAISPYVHQADFFHISNEVSIYPTCPDSGEELLGGIWSFCSKREHFDLLTYLGVDVVELTGNHNNDYGFDAYRDTLGFYTANHMLTVGGGETLDDARQPLLLDHHGNRIAMVACNWIGPYYALADDEKDRPGTAYCDWNWLNETLPQLAASNDVLIVTVQYEEFESYKPSDQQIYDFRVLAQLGANVVVGTQAHKPQTFAFYGTEEEGESFIHYGLGNLFFDQETWGNQRFFMDQLFIYDGQLQTVDLFTGIIDEQARPRPQTPDERYNFLHFMLVQQNEF